MTQPWIVPRTSGAWALFLDVDGTLIDIAATPGEVHVEPDLPSLLERLRARFGGALALVSGREIAVLDAFFSPTRLPAAGIHGVERRDARGGMHFAGLEPEELEPARHELRRFVAEHPEVLLEDKGRSVGLHYRLAPQLESQVHELVRRVLPLLPPQAHAQHGHFVVELKSAAANKRTAIAEFMKEAPFAGRLPVFIGDDITDRDGFEYVESEGGHALYVGPAPEPGRGWLPDPAAVRAWLRAIAADTRLGQSGP